MNKKLIAVAVAGALGAPGVALAQASTVQIYGRFLIDYGVHVRQPNTAAGLSRHNADLLDSSSSRIGFKGEEKLGGGLSAWFQCESTLELFPADTATWCTRNSALGLKGGFGNVYIGTWDSPLKVAVATTRMTNNAGLLGTRHMLLRGPKGTGFDGASAASGNFSLRNRNSVNYESPQFGGFQARAQYTTQQNALDAPSTDARAKRRNLGLGADYRQGPVVVAAAWARHEDVAVAGRDDTGWALGATYKIGEFKGGITYTDLKKEPAPTTDIKRKSWNLALEYDMSGPGSILLVYTHAGNFTGTAPGAGPDTGAKKWMIGYHHSLSKRTVAGVSYVHLRNEARGAYTLSESFSTTDVLGGTASAFVLSLVHRF